MKITHFVKSSDIVSFKKEFLVKICVRQFFYWQNNTIKVCGGWVSNPAGTTSTVKQISASNFRSVSVLSPMIKDRQCSKAVCLKDEVYIFGGWDDTSSIPKWIRSIKKYFSSSNTWSRVAVMYDDRLNFCAFMDKIFIIGGEFRCSNVTGSCLQFDTKYYS